MLRQFTVDSSRQAVLSRFHELAHDVLDPGGRLAFAKDDLGKAAALPALKIDVSKAQVGDRRSIQLLKSVIDTHAAQTDLFEQLTQIGCFHERIHQDKGMPGCFDILAVRIGSGPV